MGAITQIVIKFIWYCFLFRRNCPLLFFFSFHFIWVATKQFKFMIKSNDFVRSLTLLSALQVIQSIAALFSLFFQSETLLFCWKTIKFFLLCIIKLKQKSEDFVRKRTYASFNCWNWSSFYFYFVILFAAIWWTAIQCSRFDLFQLYSASVCFFIISSCGFLHTIGIQTPTANCLTVTTALTFIIINFIYMIFSYD